MSTDAVGALRQRMIEDMNARKLCAGTQTRPYPQLQAVRRVSSIAHLTWPPRGRPPLPAAPGRDRREHL